MEEARQTGHQPGREILPFQLNIKELLTIILMLLQESVSYTASVFSKIIPYIRTSPFHIISVDSKPGNILGFCTSNTYLFMISRLKPDFPKELQTEILCL